jgi:hypothetical protein
LEISDIFKTGSGLLKSEELPKQARTYRKALRDEFSSMSGVRIVSRAFRDLLEEMDPGVHQLLPLKIIFASRSETRFILNVHVAQDTVIDALSDVRKHPNADNIMHFNFLRSGEGPVKVSINTASCGPCHLWREKRYPGSLLISDRLHEEIMRRKLRVFKMRKAIDF